MVLMFDLIAKVGTISNKDAETTPITTKTVNFSVRASQARCQRICAR